MSLYPYQKSIPRDLFQHPFPCVRGPLKRYREAELRKSMSEDLTLTDSSRDQQK